MRILTNTLLRYKKFREEQEQLHVEWSKRNDSRTAALARGEKVGPAERDPTAEVEVGLWGIIKFILTTVFIIALAGKFVTGSWMWEKELGKWGKVSTYWPANQELYSESLLAMFDGRNEATPLYIAVSFFCLRFGCVGPWLMRAWIFLVGWGCV